MKVLSILAIVSTVALGGCWFQVPHKHHDNDVKVSGQLIPAPKTQVVVGPTVDSLDVRVTAIEKRLNDAKAARMKAAQDAAKKQAGVFSRLRGAVE